MKVEVKITGTLFKELEMQAERYSPTHLAYINRRITAPIIHAEVTKTFELEALRRPRHWDELRLFYAKIKAQTANSKPRMPNRQPESLGKYPTPWGNIGVRYGALYGSLGTILQITDKKVVYGTDNSYAEKFAKGFIVKRVIADYATKRGTVTHYHDLKTPIKVPARPFDYMSVAAQNAIAEAIELYLTAPLGRKRIVIPDFNRNMLVAGGRNVRILYS